MSDEFELLERNGVIELVFTRPAKLNAITNAMLDAVRDAALALEQRSDLRVMLLRAHGPYFSAGRDISGSLTPHFQGSSLEARRWYRHGLQAVCELLERVEKPVVVAHQGPCLGGALEMSLSCDFRLAGQSARYGLPEIKLGVLPGSGGTSRLTRLIGPHWARWLVMAGRQFDAPQALSVGLVHTIFADETLEEDAWEFCRTLVELPPEALGMAKLALELAADLESAQARQVERLANSMLFLGPEHAGRMEDFKKRSRSARDGPPDDGA